MLCTHSLLWLLTISTHLLLWLSIFLSCIWYNSTSCIRIYKNFSNWSSTNSRTTKHVTLARLPSYNYSTKNVTFDTFSTLDILCHCASLHKSSTLNKNEQIQTQLQKHDNLQLTIMNILKTHSNAVIFFLLSPIIIIVPPPHKKQNKRCASMNQKK